MISGFGLWHWDGDGMASARQCGANAQKPVESRKPCGKKVTGRIPQRGSSI
jgi:hypothetical protein